MNLKKKLKYLYEQHMVIWAVNFYNMETLKGILSAAKESNQSVILQLTRGTIEYIGLKPAVAMAEAMIKDYNVEAWIHLDHGDSIELVQKCLDAGFDSVMIDASEQPFEKNIETTRKVVELAQNYGVNVEAELGYVAKLGQSAEKIGFTEPEDAEKFVGETGINALAVAIGSAHGFYKQSPKLDIERLKIINETINIPLVLHGGSGIPENQLQHAIQNGIVKINLATEIKNTFMNSLRDELGSSNEIDLRKVFPKSIEVVKQLLLNKLRIS